MLKMIFSFLMMFFLNCTQHMAIDLAVSFRGKISDIDKNPIDSARIEVIEIKAVGNQSTDNYIKKVYYSDTNGCFCLMLPGGVEWDENAFFSNKRYTKYVSSVTVKVSKAAFRDTVVTSCNTDYEESNMYMEIELQRRDDIRLLYCRSQLIYEPQMREVGAE